MKIIQSLFLILLSFSALRAATPTAITATAPSGSVTFTKVEAGEYDNRSAVMRATLPGPTGSEKLVVDEITSQNYNGERKYYSCQLVQGGVTIGKQQVTDSLITGISADSGARWVHYKAHLYGKTNQQKIEKVEDRQILAGYVFFQRKNAISPYLAVVVTPGNYYGTTKNLVCERYELTKEADGPNEDLTVYSRTGLATTWGFDPFVRQMEGQKEPRLNFTQVDLKPALYDDYQKRLEGKLKGGSLDPMGLYLAHVELSGLYQRKSQQNPSTLDELGKRMKKEMRVAEALQPQFPLKDKGKGELGLPPFTFERPVENGWGTNGKYGYKTYRVGPSGKVSLKSDALKDWDEVNDEMNKPKSNNLNSNNMNMNGMGTVSPTGFYRVELKSEQSPSGTDRSYPTLILTDINDGEMVEVAVPDTGNAEVVGWNPKKDLFYFVVNFGRNHGYNLWQFNPPQKELKKIGFSGKRVYASPDGRWLIWGNGGGDYDQSTTGFNAFSVAKGVSYRLTHSFEPKYFIGWE